MRHPLFLAAVTASLLNVGLSSSCAAASSVHLYNWYEFIAPDTAKEFERDTGIAMVMDSFDSAEVMQSKLMAGRSGYDVVVATSNVLPGLIRAGVLQELDRSQLPNWRHLDPLILEKLHSNDPGNKYAVPYLWGTTAIGYDVGKVNQVLGENPPIDTWDIIFKKENIEKLSQCGVAMMDSPSEMISITLNYLGLPHNSKNPQDYQKAQELLQTIRPYIRYFDSSKFGTDLANGNVCVVVGWGGSVYEAKVNNERLNSGRVIAYSIPREGALVWSENFVLLKDAPHPEQGKALINYMLRPEVIAKVSNQVGYPSANRDAKALVHQKLRDDPAVYLSPETIATLFALEPLPLALERIRTRVWTTVKSGI